MYTVCIWDDLDISQSLYLLIHNGICIYVTVFLYASNVKKKKKTIQMFKNKCKLTFMTKPHISCWPGWKQSTLNICPTSQTRRSLEVKWNTRGQGNKPFKGMLTPATAVLCFSFWFLDILGTSTTQRPDASLQNSFLEHVLCFGPGSPICMPPADYKQQQEM